MSIEDLRAIAAVLVAIVLPVWVAFGVVMEARR